MTTTMRAFMNPLTFLPVDDPISSWPLTSESILQYLCPEGTPWQPEQIAERYRQVTEQSGRLIAAPAEPRILERLVWPLRHAKGCYMLANYVGTIALAGMVSEMVVMLIFELGDVKLNSQPIDKKGQAALYGSEFEKLGQERRIKILAAHRLIDDPTAKDLNEIRFTRRRYLHLWSEEHSDLPEDASRCYGAALLLVVRLLNPQIIDGRVSINPSLMRYLQQRGIVSSEESTETST